MNKWLVNPVPDLSHLQKESGLSYMLSRLLYLRGHKNISQMQYFLFPFSYPSPDPFLMKDMEKSVKIINEIINNGLKIRIIGDYDQDGVAATTILLKGLKKLGANVDYSIPHRVKDGYGINVKHIKKAKDNDISLIITCDNGIASFEAAELADELGIKLIITDHHIPKEKLPMADGIINPQRKDCPYPFKDLAGASVALKLINALNRFYKKNTNSELWAYAAMGTVCDIVPLKGENRAIVLQGLKVLNDNPSPGIRALKDEAGIYGEIDVYTLGFVFGPSINAIGRLDSAEKAVELLMTPDDLTALKLAKELREANKERQELTEEAYEKALTKLSEDIPNVICLMLNCHESILGIVAGRLRDLYYRPVFCATITDDNILKGSARSIESFNMIDQMDKFKDLFLHYGGHNMAAGFSMNKDNFEEFNSKINTWNAKKDDLTKKIFIDFPIDLKYINPSIVNELERLAPFGKGNPKPIFASRNIQLAGIKIIGKNKNTLRYRFKKEGKEYTGIQFRQVKETLRYLYRKFNISLEESFNDYGSNIFVDIVYTPQMNEYNGARFLQLHVEDIR